jgi:23S rRNA (guanine745-N1)-methyltransferase
VSGRVPLDERAVALLACPVCGGPMDVLVDASGLRCAEGHQFDRARQGHVTLLPPGHRPPSGDSAGMVADRVAFLEAGHYAGITAALAGAVVADGAPSSVLDLGGGTGHHLAGVLDALPDAVGVVLTPRPTPRAGPRGRTRGRWRSSLTRGHGCPSGTAWSTGCWWCSPRAAGRRSRGCSGRPAG